MLGIAEICKFADCTPSTRNFIEGEKVLHAGHVLFCGKKSDDDDDSDCVQVIAFCLQSSNLKNAPHEIKGEITYSGIIKDIKCSCKAGLSMKCKHVVAVLLHLHTTDLRTLTAVSSTDTKCLWSIPQERKLQNYEPVPLRKHDCFLNSSAKEYSTTISNEDEEYIKDLLYNSNMESALSKHMSGRHEELVFAVDNNNTNFVELEAVFENLPSVSMLNLEKLNLGEEVKDCCKSLLCTFATDTRSICEETFCDKKKWHEHRQFRITGARCYGTFTYTNNKNPNWKDKSIKYFYPKSFKATKEMKYGIEFEPRAREIYVEQKEVNVIQLGLIVPSENPWLGYTPDGIVLKDGKPEKLIEIKCPFLGKTKSVTEILSTLKYIQFPELKLKEKHEYYGQVQLGMAILNLRTTDFIIYSSFDNSIVVIPVAINLDFVNKMLSALKVAYFSHMLHYVCITENNLPK